jgi:hypothetical protein
MEEDTATVTEAAEAGPVPAKGDAKDAAYRDGAKAISIREAAGRVLDGAERGADLTVKFGRAADTIEKHWPTLAAWMSRWFY